IDCQQGQVVFLAPLAQPLGVHRLFAGELLVAAEDHALHADEQLIEARPSLLLFEQHGSAARGADAGRVAGRPQAAAVTLVARGIVGSVNANANGGGNGRHGGLLSSKRGRQEEEIPPGKPTSVGSGTRVMGSIIKAAGEDASKKWEKVWQASRMPTGVADPPGRRTPVANIRG